MNVKQHIQIVSDNMTQIRQMISVVEWSLDYLTYDILDDERENTNKTKITILTLPLER